MPAGRDPGGSEPFLPPVKLAFQDRPENEFVIKFGNEGSRDRIGGARFFCLCKDGRIPRFKRDVMRRLRPVARLSEGDGEGVRGNAEALLEKLPRAGELIDDLVPANRLELRVSPVRGQCD